MDPFFPVFMTFLQDRSVFCFLELFSLNLPPYPLTLRHPRDPSTSPPTVETPGAEEGAKRNEGRLPTPSHQVSRTVLTL